MSEWCRKAITPLASLSLVGSSCHGWSQIHQPRRVSYAQNGQIKISFINILRPRQHCLHFADDIFKGILFNKNICISLKIPLKFVPNVRINNIPALVQIMARCRPGDKPLSEPMIVHGRIYASFGLNELEVCHSDALQTHKSKKFNWKLNQFLKAQMYYSHRELKF